MILTTERLVLREFVEDDWAAVLAYQQHPLYLRYYEWHERTPEDAREFVQMFIAQQQERPRRKYQLAITLKGEMQLIGNCGIRLDTAAAQEADIGYELDPRYWGNGYATAAAGALVQFGFSQLKLHRIWSWCIAENKGSARVLEKIGMQQEGCLKEKEYFKGRWWDVLLYGILEYEYPHISGVFHCPERRHLACIALERRHLACAALERRHLACTLGIFCWQGCAGRMPAFQYPACK